MSEVKLHLQNLDRFFDDAKATARRIDRGARQVQRAPVAFESMEELLRVLTPNRWALLRSLRSAGASSIRALATSLDRDYRGVHADVTALLGAGLVERQTNGKVFVPWSRITAEMSVDAAA
jgi:predicted transcriptional regulator